MQYHLYVSIGGDRQLARFVMDSQSGALTPTPGIGLDASPGPLAVDRAQQFLYISQRSERRLSSFRIDLRTGALAPINTVQLDTDACYIKVDRTDRYLLSSHYRAGGATIHAICEDGSIEPRPVQHVDTAEHAHSIQTDPTNRFAFVAHTTPSNMITQFRFDQETGRLTPNDPPHLRPTRPQGPRHFCFHPALNVLYSVNENGCSVTTHQIDADTGTLRDVQTLSTLPEGFNGDNVCAEIKITPSGRHLYASNRGHDSIALFTVDSRNGELTASGRQPTEPKPRMFELDPAGRFLYAAGLGSGKIAAYRLHGETGVLMLMNTYDVGPGPSWLQFVEMID